MQGTPLCKAAPFASYVAALRAIGADVDSGLRRARMPTHFEEQPDGWLPYLGLRRFLGDMACREGVVDLGPRAARVAGARQVLDAGVVSSVLAAPSAFEAMVTLSRSIRLQSTHLRIWLERRGSTLWLCHAHAVGASYAGHEVVDSYATWMLVDLMRRYFGRDWYPRRLRCRVDAGAPGPASVAALAAPEGIEVDTHPLCGAVEIPADRIWAPPFPPATAVEPPRAAHVPKTTAEMLHACLRTYVLDGRPTLRLAAAITGVSVRSLQRRLRNEGTSYSRVLDRARFEVARQQIANTDQPLTEIGLKLGYSEQSAFSRAFREWAGVAPSTFREQADLRAGRGAAPGLRCAPLSPAGDPARDPRAAAVAR